MADPERAPKLPQSAERMIREVGSKQERMVRARKEKETIWSAIGIMGMVGWSVAVPTLIGVATGVWMDRRWPERFSWTLTLLIVGLVIGCVHAWLRVKGDQR